jgi:toxin ParE1/3/4
LRRLVKKPLAESDLIDIWLYSFDTWGEAQANKYIKTLDSNLAKLLRNPLLGKSRDHLRARYRSVQIERHVVFYRVTENELELVRVLHVSMDPEFHL